MQLRLPHQEEKKVEITINMPEWMVRDLANAMRAEEVSAEIVERALVRLYAEVFNPLTGQQTKV